MANRKGAEVTHYMKKIAAEWNQLKELNEILTREERKHQKYGSQPKKEEEWITFKHMGPFHS